MTLLHYLQKEEHRGVLLYQKWEVMLLGPFGGLHLQVILAVSLPAMVQFEEQFDVPSFGPINSNSLPL